MEQKPLQADFEAEFTFISAEAGGRKTGPPFQGYRSDLFYEGDRIEDGIYMVWPRFLTEDGQEMETGAPAPIRGKANFYIVNPKLRKEVHQHKLKVGTKFYMMEGSHRTASCIVTRILSLHENIRERSA